MCHSMVRTNRCRNRHSNMGMQESKEAGFRTHSVEDSGYLDS